jgi:hypothetical protein
LRPHTDRYLRAVSHSQSCEPQQPPSHVWPPLPAAAQPSSTRPRSPRCRAAARGRKPWPRLLRCDSSTESGRRLRSGEPPSGVKASETRWGAGPICVHWRGPALVSAALGTTTRRTVSTRLLPRPPQHPHAPQSSQHPSRGAAQHYGRKHQLRR